MRLAIAFLFVILLSWTSQCAAYDFSSSCSRAFRSSRMYPRPAVPCDLTKQIYCTTPGENYPWQAIRSFIKENQGLMKRMYGDDRHISILKGELENFIEEANIGKIKKPTQNAEDEVRRRVTYTKKSRALKAKPHFRPIQDKRRTDNDTLSVRPLSTTSNKTKPIDTKNGNKTEMSNETLNDKTISYKTKLESIANIEINDLEPHVITLETVVKQSLKTNNIYSNYDNFRKEQLKIVVNNDTDKNTTAITSTENIEIADTTTDDSAQNEDTTTITSKDEWRPTSSDASTLPPTLLFSVHEKTDRIDTNMNDKKDDLTQKQQFPERPSVIKLGGENACESKNTLEAPFWANNTKNELLALVNMYPFEQYIHMETCVHEKKQMYCREGCRCEQQYRLHRLLAYDPRNECRGIFSDWFKFPVCCVCKCYDVPVEFRARSPRILPPQYDEEIKRVIYEDVARNWYSSSFDEDPEDMF